MRKEQIGPHSYRWVRDPIDLAIDYTPWIIGGLVAVTLGAGLFLLIYLALQPPAPTFALKRSEWSCTQEHTSFIPIIQPVGKNFITTMLPSTHCVNYHRNGK